MSRTKELIKQLNVLLKTVTDNVYHEIAADSALYPYLVFESDEIAYEDGKATIMLECNILDYGNSTSTVEILADNLQDLLHKYYFINDIIQFTAYKLNKNTIPEEDKKIRRKRLTFEIQLHELKGE